jgi:hypothetical protein
LFILKNIFEIETIKVQISQLGGMTSEALFCIGGFLLCREACHRHTARCAFALHGKATIFRILFPFFFKFFY